MASFQLIMHFREIDVKINNLFQLILHFNQEIDVKNNHLVSERDSNSRPLDHECPTT